MTIYLTEDIFLADDVGYDLGRKKDTGSVLFVKTGYFTRIVEKRLFDSREAAQKWADRRTVEIAREMRDSLVSYFRTQ